LMLHNSYVYHGGEDESFAAEALMLQDAGHHVETIHVTNQVVQGVAAVQVALEAIWSPKSYRMVDAKLSERKFDVLHVQNFFPLISPSVYAAARKHGVAVVQSLRNYRLLCPSTTLFRNGKICEDCLHKAFKYPGVVHGCYRNSVMSSAAVAAMTGFHTLKGTWREAVDLYISLSQSSRTKFVEAGLPAEKIFVKGNVVHPDPGPGDGEAGYVLFAGRLAREKGLETLLSAWEQLATLRRLKIVGDGLLAPEVEAFCKRHANVEWLGAKSSSEVYELMGAASLFVFPSEWYEPFGRVAIESFAKGTPVVASNMAAMAEVVEDGRTGMLFRPGDAKDLAGKLRWAEEHPAELREMRVAARRCYEEKYTVAQNCDLLIGAYELAKRRRAAILDVDQDEEAREKATGLKEVAVSDIRKPVVAKVEMSGGSAGSGAAPAKSAVLQEEQVQFFEDQGYLRVENFTTAEEIREIRQALEGLFASRRGEKEGAFADLVAGADHADEMSSPQILNPVNYLPKLHQTQCFKNGLRMAKQLLGEDARCFFDLSILKKPKVGKATPWHQDEAFRDPNFEYRELTVWVALQEVKAETGCLQFIPQSHKAPVFDHRSANNDPTSQALECVGEFEHAKAVACPLKPGGCTIHHHRTLHFAAPNVSDTARYTYIMTFGVTPKPLAEKRTFAWLNQKAAPIQERKRQWMRHGGVLITAWRRLRRGDLVSWQAAVYGVRRSIKLLRKGI
jgi:glycosyltransferase involved in cell wall biosynthesis/ectoine hydroxylase-related dioxygenase (phytanoyl-CoA dioxygenase family)